VTLDFARARRNSFLALLALNEIEDVSLALGQHFLLLRKSGACASSNEQMS
jgi:hypothetical protein